MRRLLLVLGLALACGCSAPSPSTEIEQPRPYYPDRTTPDACWKTYVWAWHTGDVRVLEQIYGLWLYPELEKQIQVNGSHGVADWYRKGSEGMKIEAAHWDQQPLPREGQKRPEEPLVAYLTASISLPGEAPVEVRFSFLKRPDGWCVSGRKPLR
jgi:hypothetical protein